MENTTGMDNASTFIQSPIDNDGGNSALTETITSSPVNWNIEEFAFVCESENKVENSIVEVKIEENAVVIVRNEENATEGMTQEQAIIAEKNKEKAMEEEENGHNVTEEQNNDIDAMEEDDEEGGGGSVKEEKQRDEKVKTNREGKGTKSRRRGRRKVAQRGPKKMAAGEGGGNGEEEKQKDEKVEANSKEKGNKSRKRIRRKNLAQRGSETMAAKVEDRPGSSGKNKASKKAESMGLIFMCSSKTKKECYRYNVFGLPASKRNIVQKVYKGMRLFLFDFDLRLMYGIYKAGGHGAYNIEPKAFNSQFPSQVRFTVLEDCLPLAEDKFRKVIKENYYTRNKFNCELNAEQVKKLCKLFSASNKVPKSKKSVRSHGAETHKSIDRVGIRRRGEERRSALGGQHHYYDRPVMYEREDFVSPVAPLSRVQLLPQPALPPSYVELHDAYRHDLLLQNRGSYRQDQLLDLHDAYRHDRLLEQRDPRHLELESRHLDENTRRDACLSYREHASYRDPVYSAGLLPQEHHPPPGLLPEYRPGRLLPEYHSSAGPLLEYHPYQPRYRY